jgi:hypothetical protein
MQTFLPYQNFAQSAKVLDSKRLGNQRVEAKQIFDALQKGPGAPWYNHPAVQQWKGYEEILKSYFNAMVKEWINRGYENNMEFLKITPTTDVYPIPWWLGNEDFHRSHRARLIAKNHTYSFLPGWEKDTNYNDSRYWWPDNKTRTFKIIIPKSER